MPDRTCHQPLATAPGYSMRVLFLSDLETTGGAAIAASRIARSLTGTEVEIIRVCGLRAPDHSVEAHDWQLIDGGLKRPWEILVNGMRRAAPGMARRLGQEIAAHTLRAVLNRLTFDLLHVHAIHNSYWNHDTLSALPPTLPTVWTFHDHWGFSPESYRFRSLDGVWIRLKPDGEDRELAMQRRLRYFGSRKHLRLVGNSEATAGLASEALGREVAVIPYGLPLELYTPLPREVARAALGLPAGAFVVGFSADNTSDPVKGFPVLQQALALLDHPSTYALAMGSGARDMGMLGRAQVRCLGRVDNPRFQAIVYSAADVFVVPSLAEALGQVAMEAIACGTPVIASRTGGLVDVVEPGSTGWLFEPGDRRELHNLLASIAADPERGHALRGSCRKKAETRWSMERQAQDYLRLYRDLRHEMQPRQV
jgi:glycosyltransferase involved in cell wall biosynthesis